MYFPLNIYLGLLRAIHTLQIIVILQGFLYAYTNSRSCILTKTSIIYGAVFNMIGAPGPSNEGAPSKTKVIRYTGFSNDVCIEDCETKLVRETIFIYNLEIISIIPWIRVVVVYYLDKFR